MCFKTKCVLLARWAQSLHKQNLVSEAISVTALHINPLTC